MKGPLCGSAVHAGACQEDMLRRPQWGPLLPLSLLCVPTVTTPLRWLPWARSKRALYRLSLTSGWHLVPRKHSSNSCPGKLWKCSHPQSSPLLLHSEDLTANQVEFGLIKFSSMSDPSHPTEGDTYQALCLVSWKSLSLAPNADPRGRMGSRSRGEWWWGGLNIL